MSDLAEMKLCSKRDITSLFHRSYHLELLVWKCNVIIFEMLKTWKALGVELKQLRYCFKISLQHMARYVG